MPAARTLAAHRLHRAQPPRQTDPAPKLLTAPGYRPPGQPAGQLAQPIDFGKIRQPVTLSRPAPPPLPPEVVAHIAALVAARR